MLELYDGKLSCTVLRGGGGGNAAPLPDSPFSSLSDSLHRQAASPNHELSQASSFPHLTLDTSGIQ